MPDDLPLPPAVHRTPRFHSAILRVETNRCGREDPSLSRETTPLAWYEVTLPRSGLWYRHQGSRALPVDVCTAHLFHAGETYRVSHPRGCGDVNTGIVLEERTLREIAGWAEPGADQRERLFSRPTVALDARTHACHELLLRMLDPNRGEGAEPVAVEERVLRLVARLLHGTAARRAEDRPVPLSQRETAEAARALLHETDGESASLSGLARRLGVSPFHLCRIFPAHTGTTLHGYRCALRLRRAVRMVIESDLDLADVAARTGFADRSHLSRSCRSALGVAPSALRRRRPAAEAERLLDRWLSPSPGNPADRRARSFTPRPPAAR